MVDSHGISMPEAASGWTVVALPTPVLGSDDGRVFPLNGEEYALPAQ